VGTGFTGGATPDGRRLRNAIAFTAPGTVAEVEIVRGGEEGTVSAEVADLYESRIAAVGGMSFQELGVGVRTVTPVIARELGYRGGGVEGVQVIEVTPGSPAQEAGLEVGDIVVSVARLSRGGGEEYVSTPTVEEFSAALAQAGPREVLRLRVVRGTMRGYVDVARRP
jgi:serine protease Do